MLLFAVVCATILGMVFEKYLAETPSKNENESNNSEDDNCSVSTINDDCEKDGAIVLADDINKGKFENICVSNSSDVHFGNKTFYQGPVTIKQFVYANNALENDITNSTLKIKDRENVINNDIECDSVKNATENKSNNSYKSYSIKNTISARNHSKISKGLEWIRKHLIVFGILMIILFVALSTLIVVLATKEYRNVDIPNRNIEDSPELEDADPSNPHLDPNRPVTLSGKLKIISRREWVAQPANATANPLILPVPYVVIMHTATDNCNDQAECTLTIRHIQSFHIDSRKWWDIGYNFLVGGDGSVYVGRGWKGEGAHTLGYNAKSIGIAFVGTFNNVLPKESQINACQLLIKKGVEERYIQSNYSLFGATQLSQTQSPGVMFFEELKKWPHFSKIPKM